MPKIIVIGHLRLIAKVIVENVVTCFFIGTQCMYKYFDPIGNQSNRSKFSNTYHRQ